MRKLIIGLVCAVMLSAMALPALAGPSDTIVVTLTPGGTADIDVSANTWGGEGAIVGSGLTHTTNSTFNIENKGTAQVIVKIKAEKTSGIWLLDEDGTPDQDNVSFVWQKPIINGVDSWDTYITGSDTTFITALPAPAGSDTVLFGLGVVMPATSTTSGAQVFTITFTATAT